MEPLGYKRTILVFQPHTYTRTAALFEDFCGSALQAGCVFTSPRSTRHVRRTTLKISSADLAQHIPGSMFLDSFEEIENSLRATARPGDVILTVGAGDVYKIGEAIVE